MKKSILNLKGAQELSKNEQKSVNGGIRRPEPTCQDGTYPTTVEVCMARPGGWNWEHATGCCYRADGFMGI